MTQLQPPDAHHLSAAEGWLVVAVAQNVIDTAHPLTGLTPDYANFDASPQPAPWKPASSNFQFDFCRTAMNWSVDWAWWAKDARQCEPSDRVQAFFESKGMTNYGNQFTLDDRQLDKDRSASLVAFNATASLAASHPRAKEFVEAFWNTPVPTGQQRSYAGMLYLLGLLHCSGEFRIWITK
jgi:oligosaccharide reducing-end xylanase